MSVTVAVQIAVVDILLNHAGVSALVGDRIISGTAPEDYPTPFLQLPASEENDFARFGAVPSRGVESLDAYSTDRDHLEVKRVYQAVHDALDRMTVALQGGGTIRGRVTLLTTLNDPGGSSHAVIRYTWSQVT